MLLDLFNINGEKTGTVEALDSVFGIEPNKAVLHEVLTAELAAARQGTASTKTRAEVRGGGRKPFKQKGTGRARQGSIRAPHMVGGGVTFGPQPKSFEKKVAIFKHSTRCHISKTVLRNFESEVQNTDKNVEYYFLDLLAHRNLSNKIAEDFGVEHQSPQLIVLENGKSVKDASHQAISLHLVS